MKESNKVRSFFCVSFFVYPFSFSVNTTYKVYVFIRFWPAVFRWWRWWRFRRPCCVHVYRYYTTCSSIQNVKNTIETRICLQNQYLKYTKDTNFTSHLNVCVYVPCVSILVIWVNTWRKKNVRKTRRGKMVQKSEQWYFGQILKINTTKQNEMYNADFESHV